MAGRWRMAIGADHLRRDAGADLPVRRLAHRGGSPAITIGTLVAFTTLQTRLFFPIRSLLSVQASTCRARWRCSSACSSTSTCRSRSTERDGAVALDPRACAARSRSTTSAFRYEPDGGRTLRDVDLVVRAGHDAGAWSARPARGKTTLAYLLARLYDVDRGRGDDRRHRRARPAVRLAAPRPSASCPRRPTSSTPSIAREPALRPARRDRRRARAGGARGADPRPDRVAARGLRHGRRRARLPLLGRREAAHRDRPRDPARPAGAGARRGDERARHRDRAGGAGGARRASPRGARRSPSPTACRPSATPTRSWCSTTAWSWSAAPTTSWSSTRGRYAQLVERDALVV